jgi:DNA repair exonuclease SbcCD ATPase subunit
MRIALSRIGASSLSCSQLFLDEAFGSFDEANRADVGDFLRGLLASYDSVVLVSHVLPTDARDETVSIERSATGDSLLVYE